jgi:23S rRNA-/tRNA-specific pseudouridylate synthase
MYGGKVVSEADLTGSGSTEPIIKHQALHAWRIRFRHPITEKSMELEAPFHGPFKDLVQILRSSRSV